MRHVSRKASQVSLVTLFCFSFRFPFDIECKYSLFKLLSKCYEESSLFMKFYYKNCSNHFYDYFMQQRSEGLNFKSS